jgi:tetratricopeptide (TPR) repeat protein
MKRNFRHSLATLFVSIIFASIPRVAFAQDALSRAKGFYESADYEEALQLLETLRGKATNTEAAAYRVFCLVALGRNDEAKVAVEAIVRVDPLFRPTDAQVSPRLRSFFEDVRKPLLPEMARQSYNSAKTAFDNKNWAPALADFDRVLALLTEIGGAEQGVADLRTLAGGFRDLARAALEPPKLAAPPPPATPPPSPTPAAPAEPAIYGMQHTDVKRPVAISKTMPDWRPENAVEERMTFEGAVEVVVGEDGKVLSTRLLDPVHPRYDPLLLKAAATWTFRPATKNGVAVKFRYTIAVKLGT